MLPMFLHTHMKSPFLLSWQLRYFVIIHGCFEISIMFFRQSEIILYLVIILTAFLNTSKHVPMSFFYSYSIVLSYDYFDY